VRKFSEFQQRGPMQLNCITLKNNQHRPTNYNRSRQTLFKTCY